MTYDQFSVKICEMVISHLFISYIYCWIKRFTQKILKYNINFLAQLFVFGYFKIEISFQNSNTDGQLFINCLRSSSSINFKSSISRSALYSTVGCYMRHPFSMTKPKKKCSINSKEGIKAFKFKNCLLKSANRNSSLST